jgi:hypothetical protein
MTVVGKLKQVVAGVIGDGKLAEEGKMAGSTKPKPGSKVRRSGNQDGAHKGGGMNATAHAGPGRASRTRPIGTKGAQLQKRVRP